VEQVSPLIRRIVAPNPSPFTSTGTCTYIIGHGRVAVLDPGPLNTTHVEAILGLLQGESVGWIIATHTHKDHTPAAAMLGSTTGAQKVGARANGSPLHDQTWQPDRIMAEGDVLAGDGFTLTAIETPGHAANHLAFALEEEQALFSGDHVMGWSSSVVIPPDGDMGAYMASLDKLRDHDESIYWPGHGGAITDPASYVRGLIQHRRQREATILSLLAQAPCSIPTLVSRMYPDMAPMLAFGAAQSVLAHLQHLIEQGRVQENAFVTEALYALAPGNDSAVFISPCPK
jgi:glyoxylase-like metal-dependent hydrolase (beta-lactamase superfamily II)